MMRNLDENKIIDISPPLSSKTAVFPGDQEFEQHFSMRTDQGDHLTLSNIKTTVHIGAHADAPNHYSKQTTSIEVCSLKNYLGLCQVMSVNVARGNRIRIADFNLNSLVAPRVLFKTNSFPNPNHWNDDFVALSAEVIEALAVKNVKLVGIDTPSVDLAKDQQLESHTVIAKHKMSILEGLVLSAVDDGLYQLIALPLPFVGADASPVRAILLSEKSERAV